jgi:hypothetical protein
MDIFDDIIKYSLYIENEVFRKGAPVVKDFINGYFLLWHHLLDFRSADDGDEIFVILESVRLSLLLFAAPVRRFLSISTYSTAEQLRKLRHIVSIHNVEAGSPLFQLRVWMVSMGFSEAEQESDVLWWAKLWVETLWHVRGGNGKSHPELEDFDWKDGFAFVEESKVAKSEENENERKAIEDKDNANLTAAAVSSVIWLERLQGERYHEMCGRVHGILQSKETVTQIKVLVERPASKAKLQISD